VFAVNRCKRGYQQTLLITVNVNRIPAKLESFVVHVPAENKVTILVRYIHGKTIVWLRGRTCVWGGRAGRQSPRGGKLNASYENKIDFSR
jgi:hypothetical protein